MQAKAPVLAKKVLIVEDDLTLWPIWKFTFSRVADDLSIDWAVSCEEALRLMQTAERSGQPFQLIITDIFLAGAVTGLELLRSDHTKRSGAKTILVSSASGLEIQKECGEELADTLFLSKPLTVRKCERAIREEILNTRGTP